jgi:hypothetical protein
MLSLEPIRKNPVATLCVLVAGILGWVACGLLNTVPPQPHLESPFAPVPAVALAVVTPEDGLTPPPKYRLVSVDLLPRLKPGMSRVEIEKVIGPPSPDSLDPVTMIDGRAVYRTAYELAESEAPHTVRPIRRIPRPPVVDEPPGPKSLVALEFDASQPGHPLIEIHYLDPLF